MLDDRTILYSLAGVALILLALIWFNNNQAKLERERGAMPDLPGSDEEEGDLDDAWLLKFVQHDGHIVGETVARHKGELILKQAGVFKAVPIAQASVEGDEIVLEGDIDWDAAIAAGTKWHEDNTKGIDPLVSEHLTKSEDVKNPALDAMKGEEE